VSIDNVVQSVVLTATSYTAATLSAAINTYVAANLPGGFKAYVTGNNVGVTTLHSGRDAKLLIKADSTIADLLGLSTVTASGSGDQGAASDADTYNDAIVTGSTNTTGAQVFTLTAESAGTSGNLTQVIVTDNIRDGTFNFQVFSNGANVESWGNLTRDTTSRLYPDSFLVTVSNYIRTVDNTGVSGLPAAGTYTLVGGTDGIPDDADDQDALLIGSDIARTGMQAFSDPEQVDIDLIAVPGHSSTSVITALLNLLSLSRKDCFGIIDPPFAFTVEEIVAWQNGTHSLNGTRFDSNYAALYWPWVKIRDTYNRVDVWVPPSGAVLATYVLSDNLGAPWFAPAGLNRGLVPLIEGVYTEPTKEERDLMYGYRNAVNPIVKVPGNEGFYIWGQKTLQRRPTALDRVNVRRLMLYLEKRIRDAAMRLLFEPHDAQLRRTFVSIASGILDNIKVQRGVTDYRVKCDEELNTPDVIDRNELRAQIGVQPTRAAEFILIEFSVHRTGSFTENADTF
jgi:phage tail sheath protein FI